MSYAPLQRKTESKPGLKVGPSHDTFEAEADRVADRVISGGKVNAWSISKMNMSHVQRDPMPNAPQASSVPPGNVAPGPFDPIPKPNDYAGAAAKLAEAFAKTELGKKIIAAVGSVAEATLASLEGKIIVGSQVAGAIAGLAGTHQALPVQLPELPLKYFGTKFKDLSIKLTLHGPLNNPTDGSLVFIYRPGAADAEKAEKKRKKEDAAKSQAAQSRSFQQFQDSLQWPAGSPQAIEKEQREAAVQDWVAKHSGLPRFEKGPAWLGGESGDQADQSESEQPGFQLNKPSLYQPYRAPEVKLLDQKLELKPMPGFDPDEAGKTIQRKAEHGANQGLDTSRVEGVLASGAVALDPATRREMEGRFGYDFTKVKLHTGAEAAASAKGVQARAYTVGTDVVFNSGTYAPATSEGRRLLAHELTHVVQQSPGLESKKQEAGRGQHAERIS